MNLKKIAILCLSFSSIILSSCTSITSINDVSEERGYAEIKKEYAQKEWDAVTRDVGDFRTRYPYSKYSAELVLLQADSYFRSRNYPTAVITYEDFIRRNPYDPNLDFANFRIAESYDRDSNKAIDRDQSNTQKAVDKYKEFLEKFPNSAEYSEKAKARTAILRKRLADHYLFIATFYWHKHLYAAALMRYIYIVNNFQEFPEITAVAKKNGAFCYKKLASMLEKKPKSEEYIFFRNETPQSLREKGKIMSGVEPK